MLTEMESVERLFSANEIDLLKIEGIGEVMAKRIRTLATAKYVSATPQELKKMAARYSLEIFTAVENTNDGKGLDIPPPAED